MNTVKVVFDDECKGLEIDIRLMKRLQQYQSNFVNKNSDHQEFFGGNLTGVHVVRFTDTDRSVWFNEIIEVDDGPLEERLLALPTINAEYHVSSDAMNLSCVWLSHAIFNSKKLNDDQKHSMLINVMLVLQYKYLTSRLFRHFKYPADKAIAEAAYAQLSYKFALKTYGSWGAVLLARAEEIISKTSIHYKTMVSMDDDEAVVYMLNDTQGRVRDMLKNIYNVFDIVHKQGTKILTTSSVIEHEGVEILKDRTSNTLAYGRYLNSIVTDRNSFIRNELVGIIEKLIHTMPPKLFMETLEWMSVNYRQHNAGVIEDVLNETMVHCFDYISNNKDVVRSTTDYATLLSKLKGVYMSSRSTDEVLFTLREKVEKIVKMATSNRNESVISSIRTGILLYIVLVTLTMKHYTSRV